MLNTNEKASSANEALNSNANTKDNIIIMPQAQADVKGNMPESFELTEKNILRFARWLWDAGYYPLPTRNTVPAFSAEKVGHYYDKDHSWFNPDNPEGVWQNCQQWNMVSLWLRDTVLVDDDSAKDAGLSFNQYRHLVGKAALVQERLPANAADTFPSKHYLFKLPAGVKLRSRRAPSADDTHKMAHPEPGFDLKTGNQLVHFKLGKRVRPHALFDLPDLPPELLKLLELNTSDKKVYSAPKERAKAKEADFAFGNLEGVSLESWAKPEWLIPQWKMRADGLNATTGRWQIVMDLVKAGLTFEHYMALPCAQERANEKGVDWIYQYDWSNAVDEKKKRDADIVPSTLEVKRPEVKANTVKSIIDELNIEHVNVLSPPGFAGEIVQALRENSYRNLDEIYPVTALAMIAAAARDVKPMTGVSNHSIIVMATAPSGGGKGISQTFFNEACIAALGRTPAGTPTSSKQPIEELVENNGEVILNVDEAHALFDQMNDKKSAHMRELEAVLLKLATNSAYNFGTRHKKEFLSEVEKELANSGLDPQTRKQLETRKEDILTGFKDKIKLVMLNISTPDKFNKVVSNDFIESGFIGRSLIVCGPTDKRPDTSDLFDSSKSKMPESLKDKLRALGYANHNVVIDEDAVQILKDFKALCNKDEYLNHPKLGALFGRAVERALSVSSILGCYTGRVKKEYTEWAVRLVLQHIDTCAGLLAINELNNAKTQEEKAEAGGDALTTWLRDILKGKEMKQGQLKQKLGKNKVMHALVQQNPGLMESALKSLEDAGDIAITRGDRGATSYRWK